MNRIDTLRLLSDAIHHIHEAGCPVGHLQTIYVKLSMQARHLGDA